MVIGSPAVSVVVPVYNACNTLSASLSSFRRQSLQSLEVIYVDDASRDDSRQLIEMAARQDSRIRLLALNQNGGAHAARAAGVQAARGDYIGFVDADDLIEADMFQVLHDACVEHDADMAICGVDNVSIDGTFISKKVNFKHNKTVTDRLFKAFCRGDFGTGSLWNKFYRRDLIRKHALRSFCWRQDIGEDTIVNIGCFLDAGRVHLNNRVLYHYVQQPNSITQSLDKAHAFAHMLKAYAAAVSLYRDRGKEVLADISVLYGRQLKYSRYRMLSVTDLASSSDMLEEALLRLATCCPEELATLIMRGFEMRKPKPRMNFSAFFLKGSLDSFWHKIRLRGRN